MKKEKKTTITTTVDEPDLKTNKSKTKKKKNEKKRNEKERKKEP